VIVQECQDKSDEHLGARMRAYGEALSLLEHGFNNLAQYKKVEPKEAKINKAR